MGAGRGRGESAGEPAGNEVTAIVSRQPFNTKTTTVLEGGSAACVQSSRHTLTHTHTRARAHTRTHL